MRARLAMPVALIAAVSVAATACQSSGGSDGSDGSGKDAPKAASAAVDYNPQPYENIKDGGTYTTVGTFDDQGNPFNVNATLTASRVWGWYNADAITYSPTGDVQYNKDYYSDVKVTVDGGNQKVVLTINPKAAFNDGTPIDWRAIEATWKANNGSDKEFATSSTDGYDQITSVAKGKDAKQAVISFKGVNASWSTLFTTFLHPKAATVENFNKAYVKKAHPEWGAGPYTVGKWDTHSGNITFVRNPKWWGRKGKLDKRVYVNLESTAAVNAFRNGQLDYTSAVDAESLKQVKGLKGTEIRSGGSPFEYSLYFNTKSPVLSDKAVRKAIQQSVDRAQIAKIQFQGLDYKEPLPGSAVLYSFQKGYEDNLSAVLKYDPAEAKKTLDAAGWKAGSDGVRAKNGKKLEVGYTLLGDDPLGKATAGAFAAMLKPAGIHLVIKKGDDADFAKTISERRFDLFLSGNRSMDPFGARYLCDFYCSDRDSNITGSGSPALDKEIRATTGIADLDEQTAAVNKVERKALQEYAFLPLFSGPSTYGVKKGLANVGATIFYTPLPETVGWQK
ncbi:ABC transporter family substrate-binding protein [Streptomyces sp. NBC_00890]|nr:ABC transporter family substrate-binding protein [Streptomyces sp. NBC_00891]WSY08758.1 ABC transporter family substrate-binding protein [Streptomyces sp. NBC_00890]WSZ10381.1 ABC transporter family substrate-binding protein [Streptomyces sp. NBC_00869]WSZ22116.1 ABC transporter family substrate-binding protein [Streptomyces sp. NBC_00870]